MASPHDHAQSPSHPFQATLAGRIQEVDEGVYSVSGTIRVPIGEIPRRMTVVALDDGRLVIFSAIELSDLEHECVEEHGRPAFLIVPNAHHRKDAPLWKRRYPDLQVIAPPGSREKVESVVPVDTTDPDFGDLRVRYVVVPGTAGREAALEVERPGGITLVLNDIVANMHDGRGLKGWLLRKMQFSGDEPHVPSPVKRMIVDGERDLRAQLLAWAAMPDLTRILVSHGDIIEHDPAGALRRLAGTLG
ncbi:MAG: hypothetical protein EOP08_01475 [Proteobacteria bacterium]|nr:MAG: hypothetical protein EOP08_01475 [Pseudomonadota bacterium]